MGERQRSDLELGHLLGHLLVDAQRRGSIPDLLRKGDDLQARGRSSLPILSPPSELSPEELSPPTQPVEPDFCLDAEPSLSTPPEIEREESRTEVLSQWVKLSNREEIALLGKFKSNSFFSKLPFDNCVTAFTFHIAANGARTLDNASDRKDRAVLFAVPSMAYSLQSCGNSRKV